MTDKESVKKSMINYIVKLMEKASYEKVRTLFLCAGNILEYGEDEENDR